MSVGNLHSLFLVENVHFSIFIMKAIQEVQKKLDHSMKLRMEKDLKQPEFNFEQILNRVSIKPIDEVFTFVSRSFAGTIYQRKDALDEEKVF